MPSQVGLTLGYNGVHPFSQVKITDRASVQELLRTLLDPLEPFFSPDKARISCPGGTATHYDETAAELEGFARPLYGLAPFIGGGGEYEGTKWWIEGLKNGTDPENPEFWGYTRSNDQRMVEMFPLGLILILAPQFWQSLNEKQRHNVEAWLGAINEKDAAESKVAFHIDRFANVAHWVPDTNWLWFRVFANLGLKKNGAKYSQEMIERDINHMESFYYGDGWCNDGPNNRHQMDYYCTSYAMHLAQLYYAKIAGDEDPVRAAEFKKRASMVSIDMIHYFDAEGRSIPFGRSLIYRFAAVALFSAMAFADVELPAPLTWGMVKGVVLRNLRWWQTQPKIWSSSGTLTIGYSYPNLYMTENYNSPGSPYWACEAFACLGAPADHPFWTSKEEPLPSSLPMVKALKHPKHIMSHLGGHWMLLNSGQFCGYAVKATHSKYGCFAYSSAYGYSVPPGLFKIEQYALASQLGFSDDNEFWHTRRRSEYAELETRDGKPVLVSVWKPFPDVTVRTTLVPPEESTPNWHLRIHKIEAGRDVKTADGSFAIYNERSIDHRYLDLYDSAKCEGTSPRVLGNYFRHSPGATNLGGQGAFAVSKGAVGIKALEDQNVCNRTAILLNADPNSNLYYNRTTIPTLEHAIKKGETVWYITGIYAKPDGSGVAKETYLDGWEKPPVIPAWLKAEMSA